MRNRALQAALDDLDAYLETDQGQVVIFDATNTTEERRQKLVREEVGSGITWTLIGGVRGNGRSQRKEAIQYFLDVVSPKSTFIKHPHRSSTSMADTNTSSSSQSAMTQKCLSRIIR